MIVTRTRGHCDGNAADEVQPTAPAWQLHQDIRTHQPDEPCAWKPQQQQAQRVDGVARSPKRFDGAGDHAPTIGDAARRSQPVGKRRHAVPWLQRIARRDQQPHLVQPQLPPRQFDDMPMPLVGGIERAAE